eukprot:scaffold625_cov324-Pavlova_lutheri.AAC.50
MLPHILAGWKPNREQRTGFGGSGAGRTLPPPRRYGTCPHIHATSGTCLRHPTCHADLMHKRMVPSGPIHRDQSTMVSGTRQGSVSY